MPAASKLPYFYERVLYKAADFIKIRMSDNAMISKKQPAVSIATADDRRNDGTIYMAEIVRDTEQYDYDIGKK
jgi:hypothetical protein